MVGPTSCLRRLSIFLEFKGYLLTFTLSSSSSISLPSNTKMTPNAYKYITFVRENYEIVINLNYFFALWETQNYT